MEAEQGDWNDASFGKRSMHEGIFVLCNGPMCRVTRLPCERMPKSCFLNGFQKLALILSIATILIAISGYIKSSPYNSILK